MKPRLLAVLLLLAALVSVRTAATAQEPADDPKAGTLVDCGAEKAAILGNTESADGNHAVGWTIRCATNQKPVDWSSYRADDPITWMGNYPTDENNSPKGEYVLLDGVIDLRTKQFTPLPTTIPYFPHKNHGSLSAKWFDDGRGGWYALVNNDARWYTDALWLVAVGPEGTRVTDLTRAADKAVTAFVRKHDAKRFKDYALTYQASGGNKGGREKDSLAKGGVVKVPFTAEIPKGDASDEGIVTIVLPKGTIAGAAGD